MQRKIEIIYLLFTVFLFCALVIRPELIGRIVLRRYKVRPISLFRAIRIGAAIFGLSAALTLLLGGE